MEGVPASLNEIMQRIPSGLPASKPAPPIGRCPSVTRKETILVLLPKPFGWSNRGYVVECDL